MQLLLYIHVMLITCTADIFVFMWGNVFISIYKTFMKTEEKKWANIVEKPVVRKWIKYSYNMKNAIMYWDFYLPDYVKFAYSFVPYYCFFFFLKGVLLSETKWSAPAIYNLLPNIAERFSRVQSKPGPGTISSDANPNAEHFSEQFLGRQTLRQALNCGLLKM